MQCRDISTPVIASSGDAWHLPHRCAADTESAIVSREHSTANVAVLRAHPLECPKREVEVDLPSQQRSHYICDKRNYRAKQAAQTRKCSQCHRSTIGCWTAGSPGSCMLLTHVFEHTETRSGQTVAAWLADVPRHALM